MKIGDVSPALRASRGFAFVTLDGEAGSVRAEARRGEGQASATRSIKQKARDLEHAEGRGGGREAEERARLREGRQGRRRRGEDDRAHRARRADSRPRRRAGGRGRRVHAAGRRGQRSDRRPTTAPPSSRWSRSRKRRRQITSLAKDKFREELLGGSPQPVLRRLHGEGEAADEDRSQPRVAAEGSLVELDVPTVNPRRRHQRAAARRDGTS